MKTVLKTIVLALIVAFAPAAFAQSSPSADSGAATQARTTAPGGPAPMPLDPSSPVNRTQKEFERAKLLLSGYHGLPAKEVFEDALDDPKVVVMAIALDEDGFSMHRKRALSALGHWKDAGVLRTYTQLLQDEETPEAIRHRLMMLTAKHFPDEALGSLKPFLSHDDLQFRLSAIEAIRRLPGDGALEALREALKSEENTVAKKRLENYTRVLR